jgi:hypothetical protein
MKLLAATFAVVLSLADLASAQPPLERVIAESIRISMPVTECVVPSIVVRISRALEIPRESNMSPRCVGHILHSLCPAKSIYMD